MAFTEAEIGYLASQPLGRLATIQPDGSPQVKPVGFGYNPRLGTIDITGYNLASSQKFRNVQRNGHAALVVDDIASTASMAGALPGDPRHRRSHHPGRGNRRRRGGAGHPHHARPGAQFRHRGTARRAAPAPGCGPAIWPARSAVQSPAQVR